MAIAFGRQLTLPTNPNCVTFAASAADVLAGRPWSGVQQISARALEDFYVASGISPTVFFSWRVSRDRKNNRIPQVTMQFVFDGPATAAHLDIIESTMAVSAVLWSESSIERIPTNSIPSLMVNGDGLHQLWRQSEGIDVAERLELVDLGVRIAHTTARDATSEQFINGVKHARFRRATVDEHDESLERMRLIFAQHFSRLIIEADGIVKEDEQHFMDTVFPEIMMRRMGLDNHAVRSEWYDESIRRLPSLLGHHDKLAMVGLFFSACYSDGSLDAREMKVLKEAGEILGLTRQDVVKYLQRFW